MSLQDAIDEIRAQSEARKQEEEQERLRTVVCPDCMAVLRIETTEKLPDDLKVVFVKHQC